MNEETWAKLKAKKEIEWQYAKPYCKPLDCYEDEASRRADVREAIREFLSIDDRREMARKKKDAYAEIADADTTRSSFTHDW